MNYQIIKEFPHPMMEKGKRPVISIYVETNIKKPDRLENPIRFKNLVKEVQASLKDKEFKRFKDLFLLFKEMEEDALFWEGATESLAILGDEEECIVYKLPVSVKSLAIVSDSYYIKPILRSFQSYGHYHVLGLNRDNFILYEANRDGIHKIPVDQQDSTMEGVLGTEKTAPHLSVASIGGDQTMYHGHGGAKDERKVDQEKFFRHVDAFVLEQYSHPYKIPLILVGLDEHQGEFRKLSKNNYLIDEGIKIDGESLDKKSFYEKIQGVMKELFKKELKVRIDFFAEAHAKDLGSDDLVQIGIAIAEGRVATLYLEENAVHPGLFDPNQGTIIQGEIENPRVGDVYDDMAEVVLSRGGEVLILEKDEMPTQSDLAALYRY